MVRFRGFDGGGGGTVIGFNFLARTHQMGEDKSYFFIIIIAN
jgi:hypothetical protein